MRLPGNQHPSDLLIMLGDSSEEGTVHDAHILSILSDEVSEPNILGDGEDPLFDTFNKRSGGFEDNNDEAKKKRNPCDSLISENASLEAPGSAHASEYTDSDEPI